MTLYWQATGPENAPTIVFLHGMGVSSWMWAEQVAALATTYHCLTIDLPGNGKSHQQEWLSLADSADQVAALISAHATNGQAHIVGLSLGGYVALHLLVRHPARVQSVIVSGLNTAPMRHGKLLTAFGSSLFGMMKWEPFAKLQARLLQLPPEAVPLFVADTNVLTSDTVRRVYEEVLMFRLPPELAKRKQPVLAVGGAKEVAAVVEGLQAFPALLPTATTRLAPSAHHAWNAEYPELFNAMIRAWIGGENLPAGLMTP